MQINGTDYVIVSPQNLQTKEGLLRRYFKFRWPDCEVDAEDENFPLHSKTLYFYREAKAKESWDKCGWTEEYNEAMVMVVIEMEQTTLIAEGEIGREIAGEVENMLKVNACFA